MKWVLIIGGGLVGVVIIVFVVGALLPRDHVAASSVWIPQPVDSVWRTVRDIAAVPSWWKEVKTSVRAADDGGREIWEQATGGFSMRFIVTEDVPPRRLVMTIDAAPDAPFGGTWTYDVSGMDGGGSLLTVTEAGYVNNALFRFMSKFVFGHHATPDGYLKALGKKFGEDVRPVHQP